MTFQTCKKCNQLKSHIKSQTWCQDCHKAAARRTNLRKKYGITPEIYDQMYADQEGRCKICSRHSTEFKRQLAVDHCHTTGKVRGLLCSNCNTAIGKLNDDPELFARAVSYLRSQDQE